MTLHNRYTWLLLASAVLLGVLAFASSAHAVGTDLHTTYEGDVDSVLMATRTSKTRGPEMAVAHPNEDANGFVVYVYSSKTGEWTDGATVSGSVDEYTARVRDAQLIDQRLNWTIAWTTDYYDGDTFVESRYYVRSFNRAGSILSDYPTDVHGLTNAATEPGQAVVRVSRVSGSLDYYVLFLNEEGEWKRNLWFQNDNNWDSRWTAHSTADDRPTVVGATKKATGNEYYIWNEGGITVQYIGSQLFDGDEADASVVVTEEDEAVVIDADRGKNGELHVLWGLGNTVYHTHIHNDGSVEDVEEIDTFVAPVTAVDIESHFNTYGNGQYIVVYRKGATYWRRFWKPKTGWGPVVAVHKRAGAVKTLPQVRMFSTGHIELVFKRKGITRVRTYNPTKKKWVGPRLVRPPFRGDGVDYTFMPRVRQEHFLSASQRASYDTFRNQDTDSDSLFIWKRTGKGFDAAKQFDLTGRVLQLATRSKGLYVLTTREGEDAVGVRLRAYVGAPGGFFN